jgi:pyruvate dehydrogenase E1 component alpha subunit
MTDAESILYKMLLIRRTEEEIIARYEKQQMRLPVHLSIGQEAIAVGACHHLRDSDMVFSTHRCHAHYLAKGGSLERMALELHGKVGGCMDGRGGSMHLMDKSVNVMSIPIVASAIPLAVGAAMANKIDGNGNIIVCFFGDAAVEEGVFHESLNFASLMQLPIIFVCENNQYSVDTHISKRQPKKNLDMMGVAHQMHILHMGGDSVFAIVEAFKQVIFDARKNEPTFVVLDTQRTHVHCGVDKEFELESDPVQLAIMNSGITKWHSIDNKIKADITLAFDTAEFTPLPTPEMASKYIYAV